MTKYNSVAPEESQEALTNALVTDELHDLVAAGRRVYVCHNDPADEGEPGEDPVGTEMELAIVLLVKALGPFDAMNVWGDWIRDGGGTSK